MADCGHAGGGAFHFARNDQSMNEVPKYEPVYLPETPKDAVWAIEVSGKDLAIMALVVMNLILLTVLCCRPRFYKAPQKKYARVVVAGDSEAQQERLQQSKAPLQ